jgi:hypothetical protein
MKISLKDDNKEAEVKLEEGEVFYWKSSLQAGGQAGGIFGYGWPPYASCGVITRLWHQCYLLASQAASAGGDNSVKLNLPGQNDFFHEHKLDPGQRFFINCAHLVGFSFPKGGGLESQRKGLVSLSCWLIGHPLPVIASGPGTILLAGRRFKEERLLKNTGVPPRQIVAFDATAEWTVCAPQADNRILSQFSNIVSGKIVIKFIDDAVVVRSKEMPSTESPMLRRIIVVIAHLVIIAIVYKLVIH